MAQVTIYHNPRCSKSRQTLALLNDRNLLVDVVEYLATPLDEATLARLLKQLGVRAQDLLRRGEPAYKELGLASKLDDEQTLIRAMVRNPVLIERPIVVCGNQARLGRPPEKVLEILPD